jgi:hypothetical protein
MTATVLLTIVLWTISLVGFVQWRVRRARARSRPVRGLRHWPIQLYVRGTAFGLLLLLVAMAWRAGAG